MKRMKLMMGAAAIFALSATGASAADLPMSVPSFSWTGAYVGVQAGYGWGKQRFSVPVLGGTVKASPKGLIVGGYAGYNYQFEGSPIVIGIETDFNYADIDDKKTLFGFTGKTRTRWTGATRARLGYAFDRVMVYGAAGVAYANRKTRLGGIGSDSKTAVGWTVGGGVEAAITDNVVARVEYRYSDYGKDRFNLGGFTTRGSYKEHRVMAGIAYKFNW